MMGIGDSEADRVRILGAKVLELLVSEQSTEGEAPSLRPTRSIQVLINLAAAIIEGGHPHASMPELSAIAETVGDDLRETTELFRNNFDATGQRGIQWFGATLEGGRPRMN